MVIMQENNSNGLLLVSESLDKLKIVIIKNFIIIILFYHFKQ